MLANLDGVCEVPDFGTCIFEAKTASAYKAGEWEDSIPDEYQLHTCATMLLESGVEAKLIQQQLGHSSITTTLNIYSHVSKRLLSTAADALENTFTKMNLK